MRLISAAMVFSVGKSEETRWYKGINGEICYNRSLRNRVWFFYSTDVRHYLAAGFCNPSDCINCEESLVQQRGSQFVNWTVLIGQYFHFLLDDWMTMTIKMTCRKTCVLTWKLNYIWSPVNLIFINFWLFQR